MNWEKEVPYNKILAELEEHKAQSEAEAMEMRKSTEAYRSK